MHSIKLKFGMYIAGHRRANPIDFGDCRMYSFFIGEEERVLIHYGLWSQIIKSVLVSKWFIQFRSNLICILKVKVTHIVLIFGI